ncbi:SpoIID/LytB domain-containing protein, partial [Patescibacteria group bacterium]|nr:SpoIID/LytB domain-containing protein [Patescibacteria group bacterium]
LYKSSFTSPMEIYFSYSNELDAARVMILHQAVIRNLRQKVLLLGEQIESLNKERDGLEKVLQDLQNERANLQSQKQQTQENIGTAEKRILSARAEQEQLMQQLAGLDNRLQELTRKAQEILARKAAAALAATTVGDIEISRAAISSSPPQDSNVYFSFWTFGYPHRVGMNQYGAYGRAKADQGYREILKAYYQGVALKESEMPEMIKIIEGDEIREIPFEDDYLLGIGEMPSCWGTPESGGLEALKAQAVAARTYAIKYTDNGRSPICITQKCQVYVGQGKVAGMCGQYWQKAVEETRGVIITYGGEPISAWYASTAGGFTLSSREVWGGTTPYTHSFKDADAEDNFYDGPSWGNSPWFHKCWGDQPWLSREQVEDLLNASLLPASYNAHLPSPANDGFTTEEILETLQKEGINPIINLKAIEIIGEETANSLLLRVFHGDTYTDLDAQRFRFVFNLRSPGTNAIWTSRFNVINS